MSKSSFRTVPIVVDQWMQLGGGTPTRLNHFTASLTEGWTKTGQSLPGWRQIIRSGSGHATTNYTVDSTYWHFDNEGRWIYKHVEFPTYPDLDHARVDQYWFKNYIDFNDPGDPSSLPSGNADADARLNFLQNIRQQQTAFQGGTFLGELRETINMIRHPAEALRRDISDYVKAAKKAASRFRTVKQKNHAIAGTYLEFQYGWRPLANDIQDAVKAFDRPGGDGSKRVHVTGYGHQSGNTNVYRQRADCTPPIRWTDQLISSCEVKYSGAVWIEPTNHPELRHWGLDATNFIPTVWELIPYSFLVDYFSNVGKVIDAMSLRNFSVVYACRNIRRKYTRTASGFHAYNNGFQDAEHTIAITGSDNGSFVVREHFQRDDVFPDIRGSLLDIHFRIPGVESPWKWLNIGALAAQRR